MKLSIDREKLLKLAILGPVSRHFKLIMENTVVGELFNQKRDLFYQNFLAALHRLDQYEIDEVKYYLKGENNVSFVKLNENEYEITISVEDERIKKQVVQVLNHD